MLGLAGPPFPPTVLGEPGPAVARPGAGFAEKNTTCGNGAPRWLQPITNVTAEREVENRHRCPGKFHGDAAVNRASGGAMAPNSKLGFHPSLNAVGKIHFFLKGNCKGRKRAPFCTLENSARFALLARAGPGWAGPGPGWA